MEKRTASTFVFRRRSWVSSLLLISLQVSLLLLALLGCYPLWLGFVLVLAVEAIVWAWRRFKTAASDPELQAKLTSQASLAPGVKSTPGQPKGQ